MLLEGRSRNINARRRSRSALIFVSARSRYRGDYYVDAEGCGFVLSVNPAVNRYIFFIRQGCRECRGKDKDNVEKVERQG